MEIPVASPVGLLAPNAPQQAAYAVPQQQQQALTQQQQGTVIHTASVLAAAAAPPPPASVHVLVPQGIASGQKLAFTTPDGQNMQVTMQENVAPGATVQVRYQPSVAQTRPGPALPRPVAATPSSQESDRQLSNMSWIVYGLSWFVCCFCGPCGICAPIAWVWVAATYYCKPREEQQRRPMQRTPAYVALITCGVVTFLSCFIFAGAVGFGIGAGAFGGNGGWHGHHSWGPPPHCHEGHALVSSTARCPHGYEFPSSVQECTDVAAAAGHRATVGVQKDCKEEPCQADVDEPYPVCSVVASEKFRVVYSEDGSQVSDSNDAKAVCVCSSGRSFHPFTKHSKWQSRGAADDGVQMMV